MKPVAVFCAIAFAVSWALFGLVYLTGGLASGLAATLLVMAAMFGPAIAALACTLIYDRGHRARALGLMIPRWKSLLAWAPFAVFGPIALCVLGVALTLVIIGANPADAAERLEAIITAHGEDMPMPADTLLLVQYAALPIGIAFNAVFLTFSEELGWRGWLQPRLTPLGFWPMCLIIGLIWGLWHTPMILMGYNYPGLGWGGIFAMTAFCILLTPYHALLRERGAGVWGPGIFHGTLNAVAGVSLLYLPSPKWPWNGLLGLGGFAIMATGCALIWLYRRRRPLPAQG